MKIGQTGEAKLISLLEAATRQTGRPPGLILGIGDDAAAWQHLPGINLATTDVMVEGVGRVKGPEYETLALLGTNLEMPNLKKVAEWNYLADDTGMDTISLGAVLSFAMELEERGMLSVGLSFGDVTGMSRHVRIIF